MRLKELLEQIQQEIQGEIEKAESVEKMRILQEQEGFALKDKADKLTAREQLITTKEANNKSESDFIVQQLAKLKGAEEKQERLKAKSEALDARETIITKEETRIKQEGLLLDEKLKKVKILYEREKELDYRDDLLKKEANHIRIQTEQLAINSKSVEDERVRLQRLAESWDIKKKN